MALYKPTPHEVEAIQVLESNTLLASEFMAGTDGFIAVEVNAEGITIETDSENITAPFGSFLVRYSGGSAFVYSKEHFLMSYDRIA